MLTGALDLPSTPLSLAALGAAAIALGCASAPPPPAVVEAGPVPQRVDTGPTSYESEIGGMDELAVDARFKSLMRPIQGCFEQGSERVEQIGGSFTIALRVDRAGNTRWAFLKASTIGDRATEKCILDLVRNETWPKPLSGEGLAEKSIEIEPAKAPLALDARRARPAVTLAKKRAASCRKGARGVFLATAYVEPNGRVRTAGVATPDEKSDAVAECMTSEIQKLRFAATGKVAKVSFEL